MQPFRPMIATLAALAALLCLSGRVVAQSEPVIVVYEDDYYQGDSRTFTGPMMNLARVGFNDRTSSIVILGGAWRVCDLADLGGPCVTLGPGEYPRMSRYGLNDRISSLAPAGFGNPNPNAGWNPNPAPPQYGRGGAVVLYENDYFTGSSRGMVSPVNNLKNLDFNDKASSVIINTGRWQFCDGADFGPPCIVLGPGRYPRLGNYGMNDNISSVRPI